MRGASDLTTAVSNEVAAQPKLGQPGELTECPTDLAEAALWYRDDGMSVIPVADKRPEVVWKPYQTELPTYEEIRDWPWPGLAIICGKISGGLLVLDVDGEDGRASISGKHLPHTPVVFTPRGMHYYYCAPEAVVASRIALMPGLDVKCEGGYVVAPPTVRSDGGAYTWADGCAIDAVPLAPAPRWLLEALETHSPDSGLTRQDHDERGLEDLWLGVSQGNRNNAAARLAGSLLRHGYSSADVLEQMRAWNARNSPPLSEKELCDVVRSIDRREQNSREKRGGKVRDDSAEHRIWQYVRDGRLSGRAILLYHAIRGLEYDRHLAPGEALAASYRLLSEWSRLSRNSIRLLLEELRGEGLVVFTLGSRRQAGGRPVATSVRRIFPIPFLGGEEVPLQQAS